MNYWIFWLPSDILFGGVWIFFLESVNGHLSQWQFCCMLYLLHLNQDESIWGKKKKNSLCPDCGFWDEENIATSYIISQL